MKTRTQMIISLAVLSLGLAGLAGLGTLAGCSRTSPVGSQAMPTATAVPTAPFGLVIDDFEHPSWPKNIGDPTNTGDYINYYGGSNLTDYGAKQTPVKTTTPAYILPYPNLDTVNTGSNLAGGTPGHSIRLHGYSGWNDNAIYYPAAYPYAQAQLLFSKPVNVDTVSPGRSISFSYMLPSNVPAPNVFSDTANFFYCFQLISANIDDYAFWGYNMMIAGVTTDTWHRVTVYFPDQTSNPKLTGPWFGSASKSWAIAKTAVVGFQIKPANKSATKGFNFDIYVDDITFN